jgi:ribosome-associated heat shock protein Hsp15
MAEKNDRHRVDTWLKQVCLFKTRSEAAEACNGGRIKVNGHSVKPSSIIKEGDVVEFTRADWERKFVVHIVPEGQVSKAEAKSCYEDQSGPPPAREDAFSRAMRLTTPQRDKGTGRPTKKDRRSMEREGFRKG